MRAILHTDQGDVRFVEEGFTPPIPDNNWGRVLDTIEAYHKSRPTYHEWEFHKPVNVNSLSLPDVVRLRPVVHRDGLFVSMTKEIQFWIYEFNVDMMFGRKLSRKEHDEFYAKEYAEFKSGKAPSTNTIKNFRRVFRADASHTNFMGTDNFACYPSQERMDMDNPKFSNIVTGRWVFKTNEQRQAKVINISKGFLQFHPMNPGDEPLFDAPLSTGRVLNGNIIARDDLRIKYGDFGDKIVMPVMLPYDDWAIVEYAVIIPSDEAPLSKKFTLR